MKKPFLNALAAITYIVAIVSIISSTSSLAPKTDTILAPIVMLSLLVLSVSLMGFLFFYQPFRLYTENQKQEAVTFFLKTVGFFACFLIIFSLLLLLV